MIMEAIVFWILLDYFLFQTTGCNDCNSLEFVKAWIVCCVQFILYHLIITDIYVLYYI